MTKRLLSVPIISILFGSEATQFGLTCSIQTLYFQLAFKRGAEKTAEPTGGDHGQADAWKKDHFAWGYKGPHANLEAAYEQLLQYRESLENPPQLVVSDLQTIEVHTNFTKAKFAEHHH